MALAVRCEPRNPVPESGRGARKRQIPPELR